MNKKEHYLNHNTFSLWVSAFLKFWIPHSSSFPLPFFTKRSRVLRWAALVPHLFSFCPCSDPAEVGVLSFMTVIGQRFNFRHKNCFWKGIGAKDVVVSLIMTCIVGFKNRSTLEGHLLPYMANVCILAFIKSKNYDFYTMVKCIETKESKSHLNCVQTRPPSVTWSEHWYWQSDFPTGFSSSTFPPQIPHSNPIVLYAFAFQEPGSKTSSHFTSAP